ncbi:unnamed protein product, partial [Protopolystoma xenopodis]
GYHLSGSPANVNRSAWRAKSTSLIVPCSNIVNVSGNTEAGRSSRQSALRVCTDATVCQQICEHSTSPDLHGCQTSGPSSSSSSYSCSVAASIPSPSSPASLLGPRSSSRSSPGKTQCCTGLIIEAASTSPDSAITGSSSSSLDSGVSLSSCAPCLKSGDSLLGPGRQKALKSPHVDLVCLYAIICIDLTSQLTSKSPLSISSSSTKSTNSWEFLTETFHVSEICFNWMFYASRFPYYSQ